MGETPPGSPWAPLRIRVFRALWLASLASNVGSWTHLVAASWLMTSLSTSAALVALLQTANSGPSFILALPAGALADVLDQAGTMSGGGHSAREVDDVALASESKDQR